MVGQKYHTWQKCQFFGIIVDIRLPDVKKRFEHAKYRILFVQTQNELKENYQQI
jgi:hypothetical protein